MKDNPKGRAPWVSIPAIVVTVLNAVMLSIMLYAWWQVSQSTTVSQVQFYQPNEKTDVNVPPTLESSTDNVVLDEDFESQCTDPTWCSIKMPSISYFHFDPPSDIKRWRKAQLQAMKGEQVLLRESIKAFPTHLDFLDGDISFRKMHLAMDFFVDERRDLSPLLPGKSSPVETDDHSTPSVPKRKKSRRLEAKDSKYPAITSPKKMNGKLLYPWEIDGKRAVPDPYDFRRAERAPVVSIGYTAFTRDSQTYFSGNRMGGAFIDRNTFFRHWRKVMHRIDTPFIAVCALNENWGFISTKFPNRTAGWGRCCDTPRDRIVYDFLNHDKTLLLVTNQHANVSHPKLMIWPRGIPVTWGMTRMMIWDTMHKVLKHNSLNPNENKKEVLLFAASSKWGPRPQILRCVSDKFDPKEFDGHSNNPPGPRLDRNAYYEKMTTAMFGLGLPGLGYDCFR